MKRTVAGLFVLAVLTSLLAGCSLLAPQSASVTVQDRPAPTAVQSPTPEVSARPALPFAEGQLYAVAYLGYEEMGDTSAYLGQESAPIHYISPGEYYLILPRYDDMAVKLYQNDMETDQPVLRYEASACQPFIVQCNVSDIFADATVSLTYQGRTVSFSPCISLEDGSVEAGESGLVLAQ